MLSQLRIDQGPWAPSGRAILGAIRRAWSPRTTLIWSVLLVFVLGSSVISPVFREPKNLLNILTQSTVLACVSIGQTMVILTGGIDLSVSSMAKLGAMVGAFLMAGQDSMLIPAAATVLIIGMVLGTLNGLLIVRGKLPPFITTFSTYFLLRGIAFVFSTSAIGQSSPALNNFYTASIFGVPAVLVPLGALWIFSWYVLKRTAFGRHVYGAGGDPNVATLAGVNVARVRVAVYIVSSLLAGLAALYIVCQSGVGDPQTAEGLELQSITAVVLGGASFFGGRGSVVGTLGGVLLLIVIGNMFSILQVNEFYQQLLQGLIIIGSVAALRVRPRGL